MIFFIISFALSLLGTLRASSLVRLLMAPRSAPYRSGTSTSVTLYHLLRTNFVTDESQARTIICHRQEIAFAVGEYHCAVRNYHLTNCRCPSDRLINLNLYTPFHYVQVSINQRLSLNVRYSSISPSQPNQSHITPLITKVILVQMLLGLGINSRWHNEELFQDA